MATLQRSTVPFRRQGSSGKIWDELYALREDGTVHYKDHLRPCQSTRERCNSSSTMPQACPRSKSIAAINPSSLLKLFGKSSREANRFPEIQKSKSKKLRKPWTLTKLSG